MEEGINLKFSDVVLITSNLVSELVICQSSGSNHWIIGFILSLFCSIQEVYEQGEPNWKENSECFWTKKGGSPKQSTV